MVLSVERVAPVSHVRSHGGWACVAALALCLAAAPRAAAAQEIVRASVGGGAEGSASSYTPSISANGRWVALQSDATNLVPDDTNGVTDVFVRGMK